MKKILLFSFIAFVFGALVAALGIFLVLKINENNSAGTEQNVEANNDEDEQEEVVEPELPLYTSNYYAVNSPRCGGFTFPFPVAQTFNYLDTNNAVLDETDMDSNLGWHYYDYTNRGGSTFISHFDESLFVGLLPLPYREKGGSGYTPSTIILNCYRSGSETLNQAFDRLEESILSENTNDFFPNFTVHSIQETTYRDYDAIKFKVGGGMFDYDVDYTLVQDENTDYTYLISNTTMSEDTKIINAAKYIESNIVF